jgi:hypothetical protein
VKKERSNPQKRQECVAYVMSHADQPIKKLADNLRLGYSTLDNWVRKATLTG